MQTDKRHLLVSPESEIVIEGFPRCANSFSVLAFEMAQDRPVRIAHHLHAKAQVQKAISLRLPTLILTREPVSATASLVTRHPAIRINQALRQYYSFYRYIEDCADKVLVADFSEITSHYDIVIDRLNRRFGTNFRQYINCQANDSKVFSIIDQLNLTVEVGNTRQLARPSAEKDRYHRVIHHQINAHPIIPRLRALHQRITSPVKYPDQSP